MTFMCITNHIVIKLINYNYSYISYIDLQLASCSYSYSAIAEFLTFPCMHAWIAIHVPVTHKLHIIYIYIYIM